MGKNGLAVGMSCSSLLLEKRENNHFSEATLVSGLYRPWPCISNLLCSLLVGITVKKEVANAFVKRQKRFDMYEW